MAKILLWKGKHEHNVQKYENPSSPNHDRKRISICKNSPYLVYGGIPLQIKKPRRLLMLITCVSMRDFACVQGNLTRQSGNPETSDITIEEAGNCPSGRLVVWDKKSGKALEPEFEKFIVVI